MKYFIKFFVVIFLVLVCNNSFAEQKIVVLDLTYVLNQSKAGKGAQDFLKKTYETDIKKFSQVEKNLKKEENDLLAKKNILSKEDFGKEMNTLRKKSVDYQTERRASIDKLSTQRAEARKKLLEKLKPILESYIKENAITLVLDKKSILGGGTPDVDITKVIVEKINKEIPSLNLK